MHLAFQVALGVVMAVTFLSLCLAAFFFRQKIFHQLHSFLNRISCRRRLLAITACSLVAVLATAGAVIWKDEQLRSKRGFTMERSFSLTGLSRGLSVTRTIAAAKCWLDSKAARYDGKYDADLDPWKAIEGTKYESYWARFPGARDEKHIELIKADIDCELAIERDARG